MKKLLIAALAVLLTTSAASAHEYTGLRYRHHVGGGDVIGAVIGGLFLGALAQDAERHREYDERWRHDDDDYVRPEWDHPYNHCYIVDQWVDENGYYHVRRHCD